MTGPYSTVINNAPAKKRIINSAFSGSKLGKMIIFHEII